MDTKSFPFELKGLTEEGTFEGYLSTYDIDECNDQVVPGAFKRTLSAWQKKKSPIPLLWQHDPNQPIGYIENAEEDETGLKVKARLLLKLGKAQEAYELLQNKVLHSMSIGYKNLKDQSVDGIRKLKEIKLYEGSLVLWPMNVTAMVTSFKADDEFLTRLKTLEDKLLALAGASDTDVVNGVTRHKPDDSLLIPADSNVHSVEEIKALLDKLTEIEMRFKHE